MKHNLLQNIIGFILKYIWLFCTLLIVMEVITVLYTAGVLVQQTADGVMSSVSGDVSGRVDGVLRLLSGMADDKRFADTSIPLFNRAVQALPYQNSYNLYMIALTDEDVNVISADQEEPPKENFSLAYRDYMQVLYSTGQYQITDAFLSGDGKNTMNYTIAVPIKKEGKVVGSVFGSIYFDDIEEILRQQSMVGGRDFYLLGKDNTVMAGEGGDINGQSFMELSEGSILFDSDVKTVNQDMLDGKPGGYWEWDEKGLTYVTYQRVLPTYWTMVYRVQYICVISKLFPILFSKIAFYIALCSSVFVLGKRYLNRHLLQVNHLLNRMADMQKEIFRSGQVDYDNLLELTKQGLTDQLTGLGTRAVLFNRVPELMCQNDYKAAVIFIDLDDLKRINDSFGHEGGDFALIYFAQILKEYEKKFNGVAVRYGGDEFILVLNIENEKSAVPVLQRLCSDLAGTVTTKQHTFTIHGSLGVSFYPEHGSNLEELICKADLALYSAKQQGKNRFAFFSANNPII